MDHSEAIGPFRHLVRAARRRWIVLDRWIVWLRLGIRVLRQPPVLVYTMGKVGSTTMAHAIETATGRPAIHVHRLVTPAARRAGERASARLGSRHAYEDWRSVFADTMLRARAGKRRGRWDVVTGVRDPVAMQVSLFFQMGLEFGYFTESEQQLGVEPDELCRRFAAFSSRLAGRDWFRDEMLTSTGIDVYATDFPWRKGVQLIEQPPFRVLVVRHEDLTTQGPKALATFLGNPEPLILPRSNVGAEKSYRALYRTFVDQVRLPCELLDRCYSEPLVRHFYSPSEIVAMRRRWEC